MTLLELLIAMSIMVMVVGALGALAKGIQQSYQYTEGYGSATQNARVVLERIGRTVREATANERFPGAIVVADEVGGWRFPEVLVVWRPSGDAAQPDGLPRFNELVIYCPNLSVPDQLIELTVPWDTREVPPVENTAAWQSEIESIRQAWSDRSVTLTKQLRSCPVSEASSASLHARGAVRFETRLRPSQADWDAYKAGDTAWDDLAWVQGIHGSQTGLRQVWVRYELQLMPEISMIAGDGAVVRPIPFFGSECIYYEMHR